jgi:uncharacterized protein YqgV (UPF0045/DUF77 family)
VIVDVECIPHPLGRDGQPYAHVDAAIAVAQASGLRHEVHAFGTTVEGPPDRLWALVREMHEASLASGAAQVVTVVKVAQHADGVAQPTIDGLTGKFRP